MVDFVFPWVNPEDPVWRADYAVACAKFGKPCDLNDVRFRDSGTLKYLFRALKANMPWARPVMLVSTESQVPTWINRKEVIIVTHGEFIPAKYLPTFNSNDIEMFLWNIPGLSERVIYGNDDTFPIAPSVPEDWFGEDGVPFFSFDDRIDSNDTTKFSAMIKRINDVVILNDPILASYMVYSNTFIKPNHIPHAILRSHMLKTWELYRKQMERSMTVFRNLDVNLNQYIYPISQFFHGGSKRRRRAGDFGRYIEPYTASEIQEAAKAIEEGKLKVLCINDTDRTDGMDLSPVMNAFEKRFPPNAQGIMLSIVILAYGNHELVGKAVKSVCDGLIEGTEAMIVLDKQPDTQTPIVVKQIASNAKTKGKITVLETPNRNSIGGARNIGIANASGEWVTFLDGDDYYRIDGMRIAKEICLSAKSDATAVEFPFISLKKGQESIRKRAFVRYRGDNGDLYYGGSNEEFNEEGTTLPVWNKVYRKSAISNVKFYDKCNVIGEDNVFTFMLLAEGAKIYYTIDTKPFLVHTKTEGSALSTFSRSNPARAEAYRMAISRLLAKGMTAAAKAELSDFSVGNAEHPSPYDRFFGYEGEDPTKEIK